MTQKPGAIPGFFFWREWTVSPFAGLSHVAGASIFRCKIDGAWCRRVRVFRLGLVWRRQADRLRYRQRLWLDAIAHKGQHAKEGSPNNQEVRQDRHPHYGFSRHGQFPAALWPGRNSRICAVDHIRDESRLRCFVCLCVERDPRRDECSHRPENWPFITEAGGKVQTKGFARVPLYFCNIFYKVCGYSTIWGRRDCCCGGGMTVFQVVSNWGAALRSPCAIKSENCWSGWRR